MAVVSCKSANIIFENVALPAINEPRAPTIGANTGQAPAKVSAARLPSARGMLLRSAEFTSEFRKIRTIGTEAANAITVGPSDTADSRHAFATCTALFLWKNAVSTTTKTNTVPGKYRVCAVTLTSDDKILRHVTAVSTSHAFSGSASRRVRIRNTTTSRYGSHAMLNDSGLSGLSSTIASAVPALLLFRSEAKSQIFFGIKIPSFVAPMHIISPVSAPNMDGNSGPRNFATASAGSVNENPPSKANRHTCKPSRTDLLGPKNRVRITTISSGIKEAIATSNITACTAMAASSSLPILSSPWPMPTSTGSPTAPEDTAALSAINANTTAASGGKPRTTSSGATIAAGVPKPAAPSKKDTNNQPMMTV